MANISSANLAPPEVLLPSQYFFAAPCDLSPVQRLYLAVLEDALECAINFGTSDKAVRLRREARYWIFARVANAPLEFVEVCHALNIDPDYLRSGLQRRLRAAAAGIRLPQVSYRQNTRRCDVISAQRPRRYDSSCASN